jgi:predicted DNA-binding protein with PD1-like motif
MRTTQLLLLTGLASLLMAQSTPPLEEGYVRRAPAPEHGKAPGMKVTELAKTGRTFQVTMQRGDEVLSGLTEFAEKNHIATAHFTAVGAIDSGVLGWFDPNKRAYKKIEIQQEAEVVSLSGNITVQNGKPFVHAHCVVAFSDGRTQGGHLIEGHVSLAMQVFVVDAGAPEAK